MRAKAVLAQWKQSPIRLCLDLRSASAYQVRHLVPSTHIPWQQLTQRCAELPPKNVPFAIVEPASCRGEWVPWLEERGWQCPWVFSDEDEELWTSDTTLVEYGPPSQRWLLFQPCPFLARQINDIESRLNNDTRTCLDIGCGSGRDVAWLMASRGWHVYALDSSHGAVERTQALAQHMGVKDQLIKTMQAKVMAEGGWRSFDDEIEMNTSKEQQYSPGMPMDTFFRDKLGCHQFDMVVTIRFLVRSILAQLPDLLKPGGMLVISHFVDDGVHEYDQPRKSHRLQLGELAELYGQRNDLEILVDIIEEIEDGRPVNSIIVTKKKDR
ncbi:S-adenosyl-L-methionine-dependent methyltransferase [Lichtheimia hyalospora FSU 10163]|nr:S-adenosyl-L-methionine-dependent methyltransferase [Lichtheimia hyalospora FSU 10163]